MTRRAFPLATLILVALNLFAYRLELAAGGRAVCEIYGLVPAQFVRSGDLTPVVTSLFLHDPAGLSHLVGNMVVLAIFGTIVEGALGFFPFLALYLVAGAAGGLLHVQVDPSATTPLVGASGAIFGVLALAAALRPRLLGFAAVFAAINIWHAFVGGNEGVSFGAHIGGFVVGALVAMTLYLADSEAMEAA